MLIASLVGDGGGGRSSGGDAEWRSDKKTLTDLDTLNQLKILRAINETIQIQAHSKV